MEKTKQLEIENDYKNQVQTLEEDLTLIGEYEAQIKQGRFIGGLNRFFNFLFSSLFFLLAFAGMFVAVFFFADIIMFIHEYFEKKGITLGQQDLESLYDILSVIKYTLIVISLICFLIASLLVTIRRRNRTIRTLYQIVSVIKKNTADRLEAAQSKLKHAKEFIAENQHRI